MMEIHVEGLCKAYGGRPVLTGLSAVFRPGITCVAAPSGTGKTTLLRLLLGLERPDGGIIRGADCRWAAVFQEDRLLENLSAAGNLRFALGEVPGEAGELLARLWRQLAEGRGLDPEAPAADPAARREEQYRRLGEAMRKSLDMAKIYEILEAGV